MTATFAELASQNPLGRRPHRAGPNLVAFLPSLRERLANGVVITANARRPGNIWPDRQFGVRISGSFQAIEQCEQNGQRYLQ
ncbi:hypothetical protein [Dactylosporangium sp. CA-233914]|uniref:hypothetical protein n=1 Tax=Dactylosporangium sp. CA-233914 TaxID=3239934 RepID=UPI003D92A7A8